MDDRIKEFYKKYPDLFLETFLGLKLSCCQKILIRLTFLLKGVNIISTVELFKSTSRFRCKKAELVSFYCQDCKVVHQNVLMSEMIIITDDGNVIICKTSFNNAIKSYLK